MGAQPGGISLTRLQTPQGIENRWEKRRAEYVGL